MESALAASHVAGAGGVRLQRAGEAEAVPAGALRLAVHLARHAQGAPAVRDARAPAHHVVVLQHKGRVLRAASGPQSIFLCEKLLEIA